MKKASKSATATAVDVGEYLSAQLRELLACTGALPAQLTELLEALAAQEKVHAASQSDVKSQILTMLPTLRAFAISLSSDLERADDLVQETILKAWAHIDSFTPGTNLRAWLFTILRNTFLSEVRRNTRQAVDGDGSIAATLLVAPEQQGHVELAQMHRALGFLSHEHREAILLVGAAGMTYEEAAQIAGCAEGTVKSRVNRARIRLAELMGLEPDDSFGPDKATTAATTWRSQDS